MLSLFWAALYTLCSKEVEREAHIDNSVNSQRIFKTLSLAHSAKNLLETNCY